MKVILVLLAVLAGVWLWRNRQAAHAEPAQSKPTQPSLPLDIVACHWCTLHIPGTDAVQGTMGRYCCLDHLHQAEP